MADITQEENQKNESQKQEGDIFSNKQQSTYQETLGSPSEQEQTPILQEQPPVISPESVENIPSQPPPFIEDKRRKYFIFGVLIFVLLFLIFLFVRFFINRVSKTPKEMNVTLTYWGLWEDETVIKGIIDDYQRTHKNITVNYIKQNPKQYRERLQAVIDRGEGPDIFRYHNTWLPMLINYLSPLPKTLISDADFEKTFYPVVSTDLKSGNNFYGSDYAVQKSETVKESDKNPGPASNVSSGD